MNTATGGPRPPRAAPSRPRHGTIRQRRLSLGVLAAVLAGSTLVLLTHLVHHGTPALTSERWDLGRDRSVGEWWGYGLLALSAAQLLRLSWLDRHRVLSAWACLLLVAVLDDALLLHERGGGWLAQRLALAAPAGLRPQDVGELLAWAVLVLPALLLVVTGHVLSRGLARSRSTRLALLTGCLVGFGAGVDVLHQALLSGVGGRADVLWGTVEDGGELLVISLITVTALRWRGGPAARVDGPAAGTRAAGPPAPP